MSFFPPCFKNVCQSDFSDMTQHILHCFKFDRRTLQMLLALSVCGTLFHGYFFAFHMLNIMTVNELLKGVVKAVTQNGTHPRGRSVKPKTWAPTLRPRHIYSFFRVNSSLWETGRSFRGGPDPGKQAENHTHTTLPLFAENSCMDDFVVSSFQIHCHSVTTVFHVLSPGPHLGGIQATLTLPHRTNHSR